ncbi:MAG: ABC transporter ATP-binding protein [Thermoprotei archaeon]|nr:MAG: ABC transporter ATP-binding protein [Thermoprotei archaeon]
MRGSGAGSILSIKSLRVEYLARRGVVKAVRDVNLEVYRNETLFIVGESGSGKSTLALALLKLVPSPGKITSGEVVYYGKRNPINILELGGERLRRFRWKEVAMVFQSALNSLNPVMRVWDQMYDVIKDHGLRVSRREAYERAKNLLTLVRLDANRVLRSYPHELSGGMRQRVMIAMSLLLDPKLLILDEPTTALDVLTQKCIIEVLKEVRRRLGLTIMFITHDLSLAAELADRVAVMYAGSIVEIGGVEEVFYESKHPYTWTLMRSIPRLSVEEELAPISGSPPDMVNLPSGCKFHPRCPFFIEGKCDSEKPELIKVEERLVACHLYGGSNHP